MKIKLDLPNYVAKYYLKNATGVDTLEFATNFVLGTNYS